ncbi:TetR/AcrR family transcriptional regulator [Pseudonocardia abyssalis]|uniref:TetR/AcrR family transcriptional regulator n=1 Tax=Pseudonocardia abyssalis TaxID=2792008 RepID=A0ABS6UXM3_9PSEU|nr:TetR/AcrR family transcriptional regulator [Pseudonocardia abyssalis]MBW0114839.1 TetR/AcrR family transcriptional regulator [Pseudonocardia abyssalis]MBW0137029.1 TetR/AcrR family transcriptional regulator [Pseudonocardia abyssalis]
MAGVGRRGRTKDPAIDIAVLEATIKVLALEGVAGTSMDRVAAEAGVSKVTVYSRWPGKSALIGAALTHLQVDHVPELTGDTTTDLVALLHEMRRQYDEVGGMSIVGTCLAAEPRSGELLALVRESTLLPRRAFFVRVLRDGVERGDLRADLDVERATSLIIGVLYADHLAGIPGGPDWAASVVDDALRGLAGGGVRP